MSKLRFSVVTSAVVLSMGLLSAHAADRSWEGAYAGGSIGYGQFRTYTSDYWCWYACDAPGNVDPAMNLSLGAGYNWQLDKNFVVGVEADYSTGFDSSESIRWSSTNGVDWKSKWDNVITIRGRAGLVVDNTLLFVTGGLARASVKYDAIEFDTGTPDRASFSGSSKGFVAGAGVEHALNKRLTVKADYLYIGLDKETACWQQNDVCNNTGDANDDSVHWSSSAYVFRVGANYRF
jgi:opacity protein-like surface antigen